MDKHTVSSTYTGDNAYGHPTFDTVRSEVGESLFQLKYRNDRSQAAVLATQLVISLGPWLPGTSFVVPIPPSRPRSVQPVTEIARQVAARMGVRCVENLLIKNSQTPQMKNVGTRDDRASALNSAFSVHDVLPKGSYDILVLDDLYDTGSTLEAATQALRLYDKIGNIFVAAITRKRP